MRIVLLLDCDLSTGTMLNQWHLPTDRQRSHYLSSQAFDSLPNLRPKGRARVGVKFLFLVKLMFGSLMRPESDSCTWVKRSKWQIRSFGRRVSLPYAHQYSSVILQCNPSFLTHAKNQWREIVIVKRGRLVCCISSAQRLCSVPPNATPV